MSAVRPPYIGVTGVTSTEDVAFLDALAGSLSAGVRLMAGVLVSGHGTLAGAAPKSARYASIGAAAATAAAARASWPVVHYNSKLGSPIDEQLACLMAAVPAARGVQLNIDRPDPGLLAAFKDRHPGVEVIVQVRLECEREAVRFIDGYVGVADHALLDVSLGSGRPMPEEWCCGVAERHGERWLSSGVRLGLAGGLGPWSGPTAARVRARLGALAEELSWDAESGTRRKEDDSMSREMCVSYVRAVASAVRP